MATTATPWQSASPARPVGWPLALTWLAVVLTGLLIAYWQTAASIVATWVRSQTYAHGFVILPISAYLIWRRRSVLAAMAPRVQWLGLVALAVLALAWLAGEAGEVLFLRQAALVAMIPAAAWALLGTRVVWAVAFPLAGWLWAGSVSADFLAGPDREWIPVVISLSLALTLVSWIGLEQKGISYSRDPRYAGETKYPYRKMLKFALDGILSELEVEPAEA